MHNINLFMRDQEDVQMKVMQRQVLGQYDGSQVHGGEDKHN